MSSFRPPVGFWVPGVCRGTSRLNLSPFSSPAESSPWSLPQRSSPVAEFRGRTILGPWGWDTPLPGRRSVSLLLETMFCQSTQKICAQRGQSPCAVIILTPPEKACTQKRNHVTQAPAFFSFTPTPCISFKRAAAKTEPASSPAKGLMSVIWEVGKKARCFGCI